MNCRKLMLVMLWGMVAVTSFAFLGCEREGPAERAGEQVDEAAENMKEAGEEVQR